MAMTYRAYLGVPSLTDVGYRFYTQATAIAARATAGVVDEGDGWYSVAGLTSAGDNIRWDSTGTPAAAAREDLTLRNLLSGFTTWSSSLCGPCGTGGSYINPLYVDEWGDGIAAPDTGGGSMTSLYSPLADDHSLPVEEGGQIHSVIGQTDYTVVFAAPKLREYDFIEADVTNIVDDDPLELGWTITERPLDGFTVRFDALPDTVNYLFNWKVRIIAQLI